MKRMVDKVTIIISVVIFISCNSSKKVTTVSSDELIRIGMMDTFTAYLEYKILDKEGKCIDDAEIVLYTKLGPLKNKSDCTKNIQSFSHFLPGTYDLLIYKENYVTRKIKKLQFGVGEMKELKIVLSEQGIPPRE